MAIAVATTTITVTRPDEADESQRDPWDGPADVTPAGRGEVIAEGVRATITRQTAISGGPGDTQTMEFLLACDPVDLTFRDVVRDDATDQDYAVTWALTTPGVAGMGHTQAGLVTVTGFGND